jgi:Rhs element Vgr protein
MNAPSPDQLAGDHVSFTIKSNNKTISSTYQVLAIDIWAGLNRLPKARLVISDGDPATGAFAISQSQDFIPGAELEVSLGYDEKETLVFSGLVYAQGIDVPPKGPSRLVVDASVKAMAMSLARHSAVFAQQGLTDSVLLKTLIESAELEAQVASTSTVYPVIVQYHCSDWDMLVSRAQINGLTVNAGQKLIVVAAPNASQQPVLHLEFGDSLQSFRAEMDASTQFAPAAVKSYAWSPASQALASSAQPRSGFKELGNVSSAELAKVFGVAKYNQQTAAGLSTQALNDWSNAELLRSQVAKIRGEAQFQGCTLAQPGTVVSLAGLGDRFNGNAFVSAVHHSVTAGLWRTKLEFGMPADWFAASARGITAPPAAGQLPAISGLQAGTVPKLATDPDGEFRVQVALPLLQATQGVGVWARLASMYASKSFGMAFMPEVGDEVVVAFMDSDPRFPVIVGSLFSKARSSPVAPTTANNTKSLVTRSKLRLDFFEDKKAVQISTPGQQSVRLDDEAGTVTLKDKHGNTVTLAAAGITLDSAADIVLKAKGKISLSAGASMQLKSVTQLTLDSAQVSVNATSSLSASSAATAKLSAGAALSIAGALININ